MSSAAVFSLLPNTNSLPAAQNLAGRHTEAVLQGPNAVLHNHAAALETRLGEKLHLRDTHEFLLYLTNYTTETASATYLKLGCGLKITLKGKKSSLKFTEWHQISEIRGLQLHLKKKTVFSKCLCIHFSPLWCISNDSQQFVFGLFIIFPLLRFCVYPLWHFSIPPKAGETTFSLGCPLTSESNLPTVTWLLYDNLFL